MRQKPVTNTKGKIWWPGAVTAYGDIPACGDWVGPGWLPPNYGDMTETQLRHASTESRIASLHPDGVRVMALMVRDGVLYYEFVGHHPCDGRLLCKAYKDNVSAHFEGPKNKERCVKLWRSNGNPVWFAGPRHEEYEVREIQPSGEIQEYVGKKNEERIVSSTWPGELTQHYRGARGTEHLVKVEWAEGNSMLFVGPQGRERKVREIHASGVYIDYHGNKGEERVLRKVDTAGTETLYQVVKPHLGALRRIKSRDGSYTDYLGPKHKEQIRLRCIERNGYRHFYYPNSNGQLYLHKSVFLADGSQRLHTAGASAALPQPVRAAAAEKSYRQKQKPKPISAEAARRAAVRRRWRSAAWRAVRLARADAEATRANEEASAQRRAVREQCDAAKAARPERAYTAAGPSHREGAPTWVAGEAPDARDEAKRAAEKDASRAAAAEAKAARRAAIARGLREYLEQMRLLRVAEAIGGSK